jgi:hypothetical protein
MHMKMATAIWFVLISACVSYSEQETCYKIAESSLVEPGENYMVPAPCPPEQVSVPGA